MASLYCLALALRLVPLTFSTLPYNIDGFALTKIAEGLGASGFWRLDASDPNIDDLKLPAFSFLWQAAVGLAGLHPLTDIQWFLPILTATVVLPMYLIGVKATGSRLVGYAAGLFIAIFGSFLFLTSVVMKEAIGLVVLPVAVLMFHERADPRKRAIALTLLLFLPFLHHVTTLIAVGMVATMIVLDHARDLSRGRFSPRRLALDIASGLAPFLVAWVYYAAVDLPNFRETVASADETALFLAITVVLAVIVVRLSRPAPLRPSRNPLLPTGGAVLVVAAAIGAILLNAGTSIFAGSLETQPAFFFVLLPVGFLAVLALIGYAVVRRTAGPMNTLIVSLLVAPIAFILFGFLRGLDPVSFRIVYRGFDFLDYGLAILAGIGLVAVGKRLRGGSPPALVALTAVFVAALVATTPMAWNTATVFGVENVTRPEEFHALAVVASLGGTSLASDQRLADTGRWWFGFNVSRSLPSAIQDHEAITGYEYALVLERWTTVGAQAFPGPNVILSRGLLEDFLGAHRVLYVAGPAGDRVFLVQLENG